MKLSSDLLKLDAAQATEQITSALRTNVLKDLRKRGAVVGLSGGIDSSVVSALCVKALGKERVLGLFMPENDSSDESLELGQKLAEKLGIETVVEPITPMLEGAGCYQRRDEAVQSVIPDYDATWKMKIVLPSVTESDAYRLYSLVAESPEGKRVTVRLPSEAYLAIVAATNFKQRCRKMLEYYHADRLNYAVAGTPNRLEYDQGFFVKNGDGAADFKPIAHLYKSQVYQLAAHLDLPKEIQSRLPTTDTYSLPQSQEEFYFSLPYQHMDVCLYAHNHALPAADVAETLNLTLEQVERVYRDIEGKRRTTSYLHLAPLLAEKVPEIRSSL
jgi:NAD+ synthase